MKESVGFIGLGKLGLPLAQNILEAGYPLTVYNRTAAKADAIVSQGALRAHTPAEAVPAGGVVVTLLWDDASVEGLVANSGFLERLGPAGLHVSMTTILPDTSKKLAELHARHGSLFVEAPVFGRAEAAVARKLFIPLAGPRLGRDRARPLLDAMGAQGVFDLGNDVGPATALKLLGNFLIVSATRSLLEGVKMVSGYGVDPAPLVAMLTQTLFAAPIYQSYGKSIVEGTAGFSQNAIPIKDVGLFIETAKQGTTPTPIASLLLHLLESQSGAAATR